MPKHRALIEKSGKTTQKFFEDLIDLYERHQMYLWRDGHIYHNHARVIFARTDFLNEMCDALPDPYNIGRRLGESTRITYLTVRNMDTRKPADRARLFQLNTEIVGLGIISEPSPGRIIIESPALRNEPFLRGYFEGTLSAKVHTLQATSDRVVFQIENDTSRKPQDKPTQK